MSIEEYAKLASTGYQGGAPAEQKAPEEEFFHSLYIAGNERKNHIGIKELSGKMQIRGVQYNLDEVNMIITHTKEILTFVERDNKKNRDNTVCFSFKDTDYPWHGTSKMNDGSSRQCPRTSPERAVNDYCNKCKAQILVAGIYCNADGSPVLTEDKKPIFIFIRGKATKYHNISNYLNDRYQEDLSPIFEPATDQSREFEKSIVNNKRFVTKVTIGEVTTQHKSIVKVFDLDKGEEIEKESIMSILNLSKQTVEQFNEKFDWSKGKKTTGYNAAATPPGILPVDGEQKEEPKEEDAGVSKKKFIFDDIKI